jgi:hypothetical protein
MLAVGGDPMATALLKKLHANATAAPSNSQTERNK